MVTIDCGGNHWLSKNARVSALSQVIITWTPLNTEQSPELAFSILV